MGEDDLPLLGTIMDAPIRAFTQPQLEEIAGRIWRSGGQPSQVAISVERYEWIMANYARWVRRERRRARMERKRRRGWA